MHIQLIPQNSPKELRSFGEFGTKGITDEYGDWSVQRTVDIYAPPTFGNAHYRFSGSGDETLVSFPFNVSGIAGPATQKPIGYQVTITTNDSYETVDHVGNRKIVGKGETVYSSISTSILTC